jgi:hypothetical protein
MIEEVFIKQFSNFSSRKVKTLQKPANKKKRKQALDMDTLFLEITNRTSR